MNGLFLSARQARSIHGFLSRGSGYNHFNGTAWSSSTANGVRIEPFRTGFPALVAAPGNKEVIVSHRVDTSGKSGGLVYNINGGIGSTSWTSTPVFEPAAQTPSMLWPRAAVSGDYMVVIANYQDSTTAQPKTVRKNGVESPLVYSRYKFSTGTWVVSDMPLPGYDSTVFTEGGNDSYSIDANGDNVAVVIGGMFNSLVLFKSADNGDTWTRTIIDTFPVPHYKFDRDTLPQSTVNNGSVHVTVDAAGKAHVFTGLCSIKDSIMADGFFTYSYARYRGGVNDNIMYWNEITKGPLNTSIASDVDSPIDGDSTITEASFTNADRRYSISNSTWPSAGIDATGRIFVTYSALSIGDETADPAQYRDIFCVYSSDNGATWSAPVNLTSYIGFNREEAYPTCAKDVTDKLHISYLKKEFPGGTVPTANEEVFEIYYLGMPVDMIVNGGVGLNEKTNEVFTVNQNYPNPFTGSTSVDVNFKRNTTATVIVTDLTGKQVYNSTFNNIPAGKSTLDINVGNIPSGFYFYSIEAEGMKVTNKMMVN